MKHGVELFGQNQDHVQRQNRIAVLRALQLRDSLSRRELASLLGLTPAALTHIIRELLDIGYVIEIGRYQSRRGRRAVGLAINPAGFSVIGIRLARDHISCGLFNPKAEIVRAKRIHLQDFQDIDGVLKRMFEITDAMLTSQQGQQEIKAIGVAAPGPLSLAEGKITFINESVHWRNIPIKKMVQDQFGLRTIIEHDANAAALAEKLFGVGRHASSLVYVAAGRGLGAGIIFNGGVYHGAIGTAGALGHTTIDPTGPPCDCGGSGCLTKYASSTAVLKTLLRAGHIEGSVDDPATMDLVVDLAQQGCTPVRETVQEAGVHLGYGLANVINLLNPELIVLGDEMSRFGSLWFDAVAASVQARLVPEIAAAVKLQLSRFSLESFTLGTAAIAIESVFSCLGKNEQTAGSNGAACCEPAQPSAPTFTKESRRL